MTRTTKTCCDGLPAGGLVVSTALRTAREQAGITRARAAAVTGLPEARITLLEEAQATWSETIARTLADLYGMPGSDTEDLLWLITPRHCHAVPDDGQAAGTRLAAVEARATRIRATTTQLPPFFYGWGTSGPHLAERAERAARQVQPTLPTPWARPWPDCPVTLLWNELTLRRGIVDKVFTADYLRHLTAMTEAGALTIRILRPTYQTGYEPVGTELTLDTSTLFVEEYIGVIAYTNGPYGVRRRHLLDRQIAAALSPSESLAAVRDAITYWEQA